ncbi:MAG: hypothetical protein HGB10_06680 [Coriobacteriia bacterium]|nr:hypothetical protein [Coriobacteriia bacterium]
MKRRGCIRGVVAVALACSVLIAAPTLAMAGVIKEGAGSHAFTLADTGGLLTLADSAGDQRLTPPYEALTVYSGAAIEFEPRSLRVMTDGSYLVACGKHGYIMRISKSGTVLRTYTAADIPGLERPFDALPMDDGGMIVVDRGALQKQGRVFRLDKDLDVVWYFGGTTGTNAGQVLDPFAIEPVGGGHYLIPDSLGNRVIEVDEDLDIVWSYGTYQKEGPGAGLLVRPHSAQRLSNGNTLICDSEDQRVIEVTKDKRIVWQFGVTSAFGSDDKHLFGANYARRLANGNTIICDSENARVIEVDHNGTVVESYGTIGRLPPSGGVLSDPRAVVRLADGSTVIADLGNTRLARYRYKPRTSWVATSGFIDPAVGKMKWFTKFSVGSTSPGSSVVMTEYSTDGQTWEDVPNGGKLPVSTKGSGIKYRLQLTTGDGDEAPVVNDLSITWSETAPSTGNNNGGTAKPKPTPRRGSNSPGSQRTTTHGGSHKATAGGSGSNETTTLAPGGDGSSVGGGTSGGSGSGEAAYTQSTTMSGWVMSEVKDEVGGPIGNSGTGGFGADAATGTSTGTGIAVLFAAYTIGLAWSPASRLFMRLAVSMTAS